MLLGFVAACSPNPPPPTTAPDVPAAQRQPAAQLLWFAEAAERGVPSGWIDEDDKLAATIAGQRVSSIAVAWSWPSNSAAIAKTYACVFEWKDGDRVALETALANAGYPLERTPGAQSLMRDGLSIALSRVVDSLTIGFYHPLDETMLPAAIASMPIPEALAKLASFSGGAPRSASYGWIAGTPHVHEIAIEGYVPADTGALEAELKQLGGSEQTRDEDPASREFAWTQDDWSVQAVLAPQSRELATERGKSVLTLILQRTRP